MCDFVLSCKFEAIDVDLSLLALSLYFYDFVSVWFSSPVQVCVS